MLQRRAAAACCRSDLLVLTGLVLLVPVSYSEWTRSGKKTKCVEAAGDSVHSGDLSPVVPVKVTVLLQRGGRLSSVLNLTKIGEFCSSCWRKSSSHV